MQSIYIKIQPTHKLEGLLIIRSFLFHIYNTTVFMEKSFIFCNNGSFTRTVAIFLSILNKNDTY